MIKESQIYVPKCDKNSSYHNILTSSQSDKSKIPSWDQIKRFNAVKKENTDLKEALKNLNKSFDIILKTQANQNKKQPPPVPNAELPNKIPYLVSYKPRCFSSYRDRISPISDLDKSSASNGLSPLQFHLKRLQTENLALKKASIGVATNGLLFANQRKKELDLLKEKLQGLEITIAGDEKVIQLQEERIRNSGKQMPVRINNKSLIRVKEGEQSELEKQINLLRERIGDLEAAKKTEEELCKSKISEMKNDTETLQTDIAYLAAKLKEKDRSCRVKKMQVKAQQREIRQNTRPITSEIYLLDPIKE